MAGFTLNPFSVGQLFSPFFSRLPGPPPFQAMNSTPAASNTSDTDCVGGKGIGPAYVLGPVKVIGSDVYGLDRDGIGCERG